MVFLGTTAAGAGQASQLQGQRWRLPLCGVGPAPGTRAGVLVMRGGRVPTREGSCFSSSCLLWTRGQGLASTAEALCCAVRWEELTSGWAGCWLSLANPPPPGDPTLSSQAVGLCFVKTQQAGPSSLGPSEEGL